MLKGSLGFASAHCAGHSVCKRKYMMTYDLKDKVVLITGAAGGIGAATARELYALGASLW